MEKGILVVSFGTSYKDTREKCIDSIENRIKDSFGEYVVKRAFTSNIIIKKMKEIDNIEIDTPYEALMKMIDDGIKDIIVQPLHVIPGFEYGKIEKSVAKANHIDGVKIRLGMPLLDDIESYDEMIEAIEFKFPELKDDEGIVLMGHGTEHFANAAYSLLQRRMDEKRNDVYIATVEGYPELEDITSELKSKYEKLYLIPLMIVAGDHAQNDMAGDEKDSWKSILESEGISVECMLSGLGENERIADIFINKIKEIE
ncbi:MAG: sirohydrochlorin cobaltochelatase [Bacillota bacterium]|nr:sirohydrochlorin cobaltochelatase [Bacillota bacterium]